MTFFAAVRARPVLIGPLEPDGGLVRNVRHVRVAGFARFAYHSLDGLPADIRRTGLDVAHLTHEKKNWRFKLAPFAFLFNRAAYLGRFQVGDARGERLFDVFRVFAVFAIDVLLVRRFNGAVLIAIFQLANVIVV